MAVVFQRGGTLVLTNGIESRRFRISPGASISQTYLEETRPIATIHNKNRLADTTTNSKSEVSLNFTTYLTPSDGILLSWYGMSDTGTHHIFDPTKEPEKGWDLYYIFDTAVYKIEDTFASAMSFNFSKLGALSVDISGQGTDWTEVSLPSFPGLTEQNPTEFKVGHLSSPQFPFIGGITLELTKGVGWRSDKTIHSSRGKIHKVSTPEFTDFAVGGTVTTYKRDSSLGYDLSTEVSYTYENGMEVYLNPCKVLERWDTGEVHRKMYDYKLRPGNTNSYIKLIN